MKIENGVLLSVTTEDLKNGCLQIPLGVKKIGDAACFDLLELEHVEFPRPNTIKEIGEGAFCRCANLKEIVIPEGLEKIGHHAFSHCINLHKVYMGSSIKYLGNSTFERCYTLDFINLQYIEYIGGSCFKDCANLPEISIHKIKSIPANCFKNCTLLKYVYISSHVQKIDCKAFYKCSSLRKIEFAPIKNVKNYTRGLQYIGDNAFEWCTHLEEIKLPETVLEIGAWAFKGCKNLKKIKTELGAEKFSFGKLDYDAKVEITK